MISSTKTNLSIAFLSLLLIVAGCAKEVKGPIPEKKTINSISFKKVNGDAFAAGECQVTIKVNTVLVTVPYGTALDGLIPEISITGKSISPASGVPQNFSAPVKYTVTGEDNTKTIYTVSVSTNANPNPGSGPGSGPGTGPDSSTTVTGIVYFGCSDNNFYAVRAATGELVWKYTGTQSFVYSSPTYANGTVYVGSIDSYVYAFDALTGAIKWKYKMGDSGVESDAVYADGTIYVGCDDDYIVALDAVTGQYKWKFTTGGNISASPTVANGTVYFGSSDDNLYALNSSTGQYKWSFHTGAMINQSGPALVNGVVYVGSRDAFLYAIDAATGILKWRYFTYVSLEQSSPTVSNGIVYIGGWYDVPAFTRKGSLYAINVATGNPVWEKLQNTGIGSSPTVANGKVYITTDDSNLYALDAATGDFVWSMPILANGASAAVAHGIVYVGGGGNGKFCAYDANTGAQKWQFTIHGLATSSPLIVSTPSDAYYSGDSGNAN